mgnify:CR=1 FL=1
MVFVDVYMRDMVEISAASCCSTRTSKSLTGHKLSGPCATDDEIFSLIFHAAESPLITRAKYALDRINNAHVLLYALAVFTHTTFRI